MTPQRSLAQSFTRVLILAAVVLAIPLVANQFVEGEGWSLFDYALVAALVIGPGILYELAVHRPGSRTAALVTAALAATGGAAAVLGEFDDAPGMVLIGFALIVAAVVVGIRTARRGAAPPEPGTQARRSA